MVDKVRPLKIEDATSGTQTDQNPTELDPTQDYVAAKGIAFENSNASLIDISPTGQIQFTDPDHAVPRSLTSVTAKLDLVQEQATKNVTDAELRDRQTHTGTQLANTISNFATVVLGTVLAGLSVATGTQVIATDTILAAFGKLQKQITDEVAARQSADTTLQTNINAKYDASNPNSYETTTQLNARDAADRSRANHTGTQLASTVSDFSAAVRLVTMTGVVFTVATAVVAGDTLLAAIGKLQKQITDEIANRASADSTLQTNINAKYDASNPNSYETTTQLNARDTSNRSRANHTGTQLSSTISDFAATSLGTVLAGLSLLTGTPITAADSFLVAFGKLQKQITDETAARIAAVNLKYDASNPSAFETPAQLNARDTANRSRANHTGTQLSATVSDLADTIRATLLTGIVFTTASAVVAGDSILVAFGKVQATLTQMAVSVTPSSIGNTNTAGTNSAFARADHIHKNFISTYGVVINDSVSTTSGTAAVVGGLTIANPVAGDYIAIVSVVNSNTAGNTNSFGLYVGGTLVPETDDTLTIGGGGIGGSANESTYFVCCKISVNGTQTVDLRWLRSAGTATATVRSITLIKVA